MYAEYFGLSEPAFSIAPDPRFLFMSARHKEALAHLVFGVQSDGGFVLLTGEVGTGKTTVCRCFLRQIPKNTQIALVLNPKLSAKELLATICDEFGIPYSREQHSSKFFIDKINNYLLQQHARRFNSVLIIDEAQNLSVSVLEQIRLLTNLETDQKKLLQVIMMGQPELKDMLSRRELRQLSQRITARYHLETLSREELEVYIAHRLRVVGCSRPLFAQRAINTIFKLSQGTPRLVNLLCDRALLGAYVKNESQVTPETVYVAAKEVLGEEYLPAQRFTPKVIAYTAAYLVAIVCVAALLFFGDYKSYVPQSWQAFFSTESKAGDDSAEGVEKLNVDDAEPAVVQEGKQSVAKAAQDEKKAEGSKVINGLDKLPLSIDTEQTLNTASQKLLVSWQVPITERVDSFNNDRVCEYATQHSLRCMNGNSNLSKLLTFNRPALVRLVLPKSVEDQDSQEVYAVLKSVQSDHVILDIADKKYMVNLNQFQAYFSGDYQIFWRAPDGYQEPLQQGAQGPVVEWLADQLGVSDLLSAAEEAQQWEVIRPKNASSDVELPGDVLGGKVLNPEIIEHVKAFQQRQGLTPDGVVGPMTIIRLNTFSGTVPLLTQVDVVVES